MVFINRRIYPWCDCAGYQSPTLEYLVECPIIIYPSRVQTPSPAVVKDTSKECPDMPGTELIFRATPSPQVSGNI